MVNYQALFDTILATIDDAVFVTDAGGRIVHVSRAFEMLTKLSAADIIGKTAQQFITEIGPLGDTRQGVITIPGHANPWLLSTSPVLHLEQTVGFITLLRRAGDGESQTREGFDALTGLPNRHLFHDRVEQALNVAQRGDKSLMVMFVGIDRFGELNDVLGESATHELLRGITTRLRQCVRTTDTVACIERDRFAFVMHIAAVDDSVLLTEKILRAFDHPLAIDEQKDIAVTCSVGASLFPADSDSGDSLLKNASVALHHAQQGGRNRCQFFSNEMNTRARHRLDVESGIRRALTHHEFLVYYQPKIDVNTRRVAGMEALVRWRDPVRGIVSPAEFIPIAEESGLIEQIGQWVLEETCTQNRRWQQEGLPPVCASVNVSARQFRNRTFVASVAEVLQRTGLDPQWLELEITESMLMGDIAAIVARMEEIRALGVSLSIDDFGTGYSSLSYLSRFPVTTLKIDRAFITDVQSNPHTAEIARAIIGLSRGLNLEVVAEGAEVVEQVEFLREHGCDLVQGFFYSKPLPAEEFAVLLRNGI